MSSKIAELRHQFVEFLPPVLDPGVLYISLEYKTIAHLCCCGCGNKVVTPLSPTSWSLEFDGHSISLNPSIGNWNLPCQSHYWVRQGRVVWAPKWSKEKIEAGFERDRREKQAFHGEAAPRTPRRKKRDE